MMFVFLCIVVLMSPIFSGNVRAEEQKLQSSKQSLEEKMIEAVIARKNVSGSEVSSIKKRIKVFKNRTEGKKWVFGSVVIVASKEEDAYPEGWLFFAKKDQDGWKVGLEGDSLFRELTGKAPNQVVSPHEKKGFLASKQLQAQTTSGRTSLQLPWSKDQSWIMTGGPHGWAGKDTEARSSLDLAGGDGVVRSSGSGAAYTMCGNTVGWVRVVHDNGYATDYYHLSTNIMPNGTRINAGDYIGKIGTTICAGGGANNPHVHFGLLFGGNRVSLEGKEIGGWVFGTGVQYQGYARHGSTVKYAGQSLYNYGILASNQGIVDSNGGTSVNLRSGPGTNYSITGSVSDGAIVTLVCTAQGTSHTGRYGTTNLWNKLSNGQWISDAFVYTGYATAVVPGCN